MARMNCSGFPLESLLLFQLEPLILRQNQLFMIFIHNSWMSMPSAFRSNYMPINLFRQRSLMTRYPRSIVKMGGTSCFYLAWNWLVVKLSHQIREHLSHSDSMVKPETGTLSEYAYSSMQRWVVDNLTDQSVYWTPHLYCQTLVLLEFLAV